ncbi:hypothetical protein ANN_18808 [Periplaneta americana]|uniref:DDE-1 domain-containing protein n=1 Tax=Periplaneta americana TaxID=6978 RepID=A0ABQ8SQA3_PERAM|nr:hypothetical protein ANN_18808 [Periplaneta americana]
MMRGRLRGQKLEDEDKLNGRKRHEQENQLYFTNEITLNRIVDDEKYFQKGERCHNIIQDQECGASAGDGNTTPRREASSSSDYEPSPEMKTNVNSIIKNIRKKLFNEFMMITKGDILCCLVEKTSIYKNKEADLGKPSPKYIIVEVNANGKMSKAHLRTFFSNVLSENISANQKCTLLCDSLTAHKDTTLINESFQGKDIECMIIPPQKETKYIQPLDIYFLRQHKIYARRITDYTRTLAENPELKSGNRVFIMKMRSVIHNQLSAPVYRSMLQYSWQSAGYVNPEQVSDFKNIIQVAFQQWSVVQRNNRKSKNGGSTATRANGGVVCGDDIRDFNATKSQTIIDAERIHPTSSKCLWRRTTISSRMGFAELKRGRTYISDDFRNSRPAVGTSNRNIDAVRQVIKEDNPITYAEIRATLGIVLTAEQKILYNILLLENVGEDGEKRKWKNINTEEGRRNYRKLNNEVRRETNKAKEDWMKVRCKEIEDLGRKGGYDLMYRQVKYLDFTNKKSNSMWLIEDEIGNEITDRPGILTRWTKYVEELYETGIVHMNWL